MLKTLQQQQGYWGKDLVKYLIHVLYFLQIANDEIKSVFVGIDLTDTISGLMQSGILG